MLQVLEIVSQKVGNWVQKKIWYAGSKGGSGSRAFLNTLINMNEQALIKFKPARREQSDHQRKHCQDRVQFSSVQSLSRVQRFATPWIAARQASLSITNPRSSLRFTSIKSVMPSRTSLNHRHTPFLWWRVILTLDFGNSGWLPKNYGKILKNKKRITLPC